MLITIRKMLTGLIKMLLRPASEEIAEHTFLALAVIIKPQLHQYQQRQVEQETQQESPPAAGMADEEQQRVPCGQRAVKVEDNYFLFLSQGMNDKSLCISQASKSAIAVINSSVSQ